ncbi:MAG: DPP IV N-terminal domain-containing protein [Desulfuromonadaceae bacterium]|nr:DPP IV N-terminal domain-containing protein [Desulfuromonadaceae bacterium]
MMIIRLFVVNVICCSILAACGGSSSDPTPSNAFKAESKSLVAGPAGGTVTHTLANGTVFTFDVPAGALPTTTTLTLVTQQQTGTQRFNLLLQPAGLLFANGNAATLTITLPPGQSLPPDGGLAYNGVPIPFTTLPDGRLEVKVTGLAESVVAKSTLSAFTALLFKDVGLSPSNACGGAPDLNTDGGLTSTNALSIEIYGQCMLTTVNDLVLSGKYSDAIRVSMAVGTYLQKTGSGDAAGFVSRASTIACDAYESALTFASITNVTTTGQLNPIIRPIFYWESIIQKLGTSCSRIPPTRYQDVVHEKITQSMDYYATQKPNITNTASSNYADAKNEAGSSARTKSEVLSLGPPAAVSNTVTTEIDGRAQPALLDSMLQAPWNKCRDEKNYDELMNLMVTMEKPETVKKAAQYAGTILSAQGKNSGGTVTSSLAQPLGGINATENRTNGSITLDKSGKLSITGPVQGLKCPLDSPGGSETLVIKLDGTTIQTLDTSPYLSNPLEINLATALETAHPGATSTLRSATVTVDRTGTPCSGFWGDNPSPLVSLALSFNDRKIVFSRDPLLTGSGGASYGTEIATINYDGTGLVRLTNNPPVQRFAEGSSYWDNGPSDASPSSSPDGQRITYLHWDSGASYIMLVNADGSGLATLTAAAPSSEDFYSPSWSPDGTRIAFVRRNYSLAMQPKTIIVMDISSGSSVEISANVYREQTSALAWSPDSTKIAYVGTSDGNVANAGIYQVNADGSGAPRLMVADSNYDPSISPSGWSPDGGKILFIGYPNGNTRGMWVMNVDGTGLTRIADVGTFQNGSASWSPDGNRISYLGMDSQIWVMNINGSNLKQVTSGPNPAYQPSWR